MAARIIYRAVFLPRNTYVRKIWSRGCTLIKGIKALGSMQRVPLVAITSSYRTVSTNCLSVVVGELSLDLEVRRAALKYRLRMDEITYATYEMEVDALIDAWQHRYDSTNKGEWTKCMLPNVKERYALPLEMDHYTSQLLTGHGNFNSKLHSFSDTSHSFFTN